jgi:hypothetical protein
MSRIDEYEASLPEEIRSDLQSDYEIKRRLFTLECRILSLGQDLSQAQKEHESLSKRLQEGK